MEFKHLVLLVVPVGMGLIPTIAILKYDKSYSLFSPIFFVGLMASLFVCVLSFVAVQSLFSEQYIEALIFGILAISGCGIPFLALKLEEK